MLGMIPAIIFVDTIYTTATAKVPKNVAIGTFFLGFSTASAFAAADSKPKNPHNVREMD